jgi:hypothetical protein
MNVYTQKDIIRFDFLKIPKALFANPQYKVMSSDAKLAYSLLFDRLSLSRQNNWLNENGEVYLIYTRENIADELGITYKKAISAFRELIGNNLIFEKRCGRGLPNMIFIIKPEISEDTVKNSKHPRTAETARLDSQEPPERKNKNGENGTSRTAKTAEQELPKPHTNKTEYIKTDFNHTDISQSVCQTRSAKVIANMNGEQTDGVVLQEILDNCKLELFDTETRITFRDAIERLFYCREFRIGTATLPGANVRSRMRRLDYGKLAGAEHSLRQNKDKPVKNITGYVMSAVFNCIAEEYSRLLVDPYLNSIRGDDYVP